MASYVHVLSISLVSACTVQLDNGTVLKSELYKYPNQAVHVQYLI